MAKDILENLKTAQEQQQQGMLVTSSENDAYDMADETTPPEILSMPKSKTETSKSQIKMETAKSQTKTETSNIQTKSDRMTMSTALFTQMQMALKTGRELASNPTERLERRAKGPSASLLTASSGRPTRGSRKVWGTGLLLYHQGLAKG
uniref:Uncharacterized protein n=1 Tax=Romanomermis culicivorax TaxID=13658 RepID=A0A915IMM8_ROMCU